jgi:hypothetical protein
MAYASSSELFNTAALNGVAVTSQLRALLIYDWNQQADRPLAGSELGCSIPAGSAAFSVSSAAQGCAVSVAASHTAGVAQRPVLLQFSTLQVEVPVTVWFPLSVKLQPADAVLNAILPPGQVISQVPTAALQRAGRGAPIVLHFT